MALSTNEIKQVNDLYKQVDALTAENNSLKEKEDMSARFDTLETLINDLACKCGHETSKSSSTK